MIFKYPCVIPTKTCSKDVESVVMMEFSFFETATKTPPALDKSEPVLYPFYKHYNSPDQAQMTGCGISAMFQRRL